jgi:hypothetical protein
MFAGRDNHMNSSPQLSSTEKQVRFELATAKLVIQASIDGIELICFRFISTMAEDLAYFNQGKSEIDPRITPTMHMQRLAKDFAVIVDGKILWDRNLAYDRVGEIAESLGLRWGGEWKSLGDIYHVEYQEGA